MTSQPDNSSEISTAPFKKIPYGASSYIRLKTDGFYFVDKTRFIPQLEQSLYPFLIRPRRMGKSLWISLLERYYDVAKKESFESSFQDTWIGQNPTSERNAYLILSFDFSDIDTNAEQVEESFNLEGKIVVHRFLEKYSAYFPQPVIDEVHEQTSLSNKLAVVFSHARLHDIKLYILIDEYDNFANTILSSIGSHAYREMTHGTGFYRRFFNKLKAATGKDDAPVARLFITGVSPVTMDDVTSGFNIGDNISLSPVFQEIVGFTEDEVYTLLNYYKSTGQLVGKVNEHIAIMRVWYNHYRFASKAHTSVYNTDMVLHYVKNVLRDKDIPEQMIDQNVKIDYNKLRHLLLVNQQSNEKSLNGNFDLLREITQKEAINSHIVESFPLKQISTRENFISLLFYFGLLTYSKTQYRGKPQLKIPNLTVKTLMYGYLRDALEDNNVFKVDIYQLSSLVENMAFDGQWQPTFSFLAKMVQEQTSVRDYLSAEKAIQSFLLAYLNINDYFITYSEAELNKGYCDILLEPHLSKYPEIPNVYLIEIKHIARSQSTESSLQAAINKAQEKAKVQLNQYSQDTILQQRNQGLTLHKLVLVFHGWELVLCEECSN